MNSTNPIFGMYDDPNHLHCNRTVTYVSPTLAHVTGFDGYPDIHECNHQTDKPWGPFNGIISADEKIIVDFSPKGGPSDLTGFY